MKDNKHVIIFTIIVILIVSVVIFISVDKKTEYRNEAKKEFSEIELKVPGIFEYDDYTYSKLYSYDENSMYCSLNVYSEEKDYYKSAKDYLENRIRFTLKDQVGELKETDVGNKIGYLLEIKTKDSMDYHYAVESKNHIYYISYTISDFNNGDREDSETNKCITSRNKIINSIKVR